MWTQREPEAGTTGTWSLLLMRPGDAWDRRARTWPTGEGRPRDETSEGDQKALCSALVTQWRQALPSWASPRQGVALTMGVAPVGNWKGRSTARAAMNLHL